MEYMITKVGRETTKTRLSKQAASNLRVVLRNSGAVGSVHDASMAIALIDSTIIAIINGRTAEVYQLPQ